MQQHHNSLKIQFNDRALSRILFDLETISKLRRGEILDTSGEFLGKHEATLATTISRTFYTHDSRYKTLMRIKVCIELAIQFAEMILESKYLAIYKTNVAVGQIEALEDAYNARLRALQAIRCGLEGAMTGLFTLSVTYEKDTNMVGNLSDIIKKIQVFLAQLELDLLALDDARADYDKKIY
jgi:hypothetical protein